MSLYKRNKFWWSRVQRQNERWDRSTRCTDKAEALQLESEWLIELEKEGNNADALVGLNVSVPSHGHTRSRKSSPEYRAYSNAQQRCENPDDRHYKWYGARGIKFLFTSFEQFFGELGFRPSPEHSVDRRDNNGHYEPGNVRWATWEEQCQNKRPHPKLM